MKAYIATVFIDKRPSDMGAVAATNVATACARAVRKAWKTRSVARPKEVSVRLNIL